MYKNRVKNVEFFFLKSLLFYLANQKNGRQTCRCSCTTNNTEIYCIEIDFAPPIIREKSLIFKKKCECTTNKNQGLAPLQKISTKWNGKNQILFCLQNK